ncbi:hypothetical protein PSN45_000842 [Yamadazyma tenuis]|uniref:Uncharacterized protein n=1 Tax=Candida tenuis (strain ATCC 10573 / BCRC 21748 / CBS 615 / JCM 9827 / NBRC 10315 / NRRL Y-1498 / VKM Y-70) TaxID=590646 RepID=G3BB25_CANTC|nr:uncharacterized protein CANTEDRAFT_115589 [Yamadazyma tenuis ATCC 10573]EGV62125.1 hypothetical protein CANTEDRAFT_115589 [Yamadazyma tenuis ATCC 10573]WEJ93379.1 hypothetical protein PSN45_000842 [Yamadazyma tenuis]
MNSNVTLLVFVVGTIVTGCLNSIFTKYQDNQCVDNCSDPDVSNHHTFQQPALQTLQMFVGEMLCYVVYYLMYRTSLLSFGADGYKPIGEDADLPQLPLASSLKLSVPAICDLVGTTMLHFGLIFIPVSVYQMIRGSLVLFVAFLSVVFLKRKVTRLEWLALVIVTGGITLVGLSGSSQGDGAAEGTSKMVMVGLVLVVVAELCQAFQFVVEEHLLRKNPIMPLQLVYFEGFYGAVVLAVALVVLYFVLGAVLDPSDFEHSPFNMKEGLSQMLGSYHIMGASVLIMLSISSFNFFGISLTFHLSATSRSTIDACRTLMVWLLAMIMGWESFHFLQFVGFGLLVFGTLCFNGVLTPEEWSWVPGVLKSSVDVAPLEEPVDRI